MAEREIAIPYEEMRRVFLSILSKHGYTADKADRIATVVAESTLDGVNSHGIDRLPELVEMTARGIIRKDAEPELIEARGALERWDGNHGPGILNAWHAMERAISIAKSHAIGIVALRNNNHWFRGGTYGWQAAKAGCMGLCFSNTQPNMPPWGSRDSRTGNNPLVIAVPHADGDVVLDMSLSQFAYGKLQSYARDKKDLPFPGGWDDEGRLTTDPAVIFQNHRILPIGYWKGSGLSIMLDLMVTVLSGGHSTYRVGRQQVENGWRDEASPGKKIIESDLSQVFVAIDLTAAGNIDLHRELVNEIIQNIRTAQPIEGGNGSQLPGDNTLRHRQRCLEHGIPVSADMWRRLGSL